MHVHVRRVANGEFEGQGLPPSMTRFSHMVKSGRRGSLRDARFSNVSILCIVGFVSTWTGVVTAVADDGASSGCPNEKLLAVRLSTVI